MTEGDEIFYTRYISVRVTIRKRSYHEYHHTNKLPHSLHNLHDLKKAVTACHYPVKDYIYAHEDMALEKVSVIPYETKWSPRRPCLRRECLLR